MSNPIIKESNEATLKSMIINIGFIAEQLRANRALLDDKLLDDLEIQSFTQLTENLSALADFIDVNRVTLITFYELYLKEIAGLSNEIAGLNDEIAGLRDQLGKTNDH